MLFEKTLQIRLKEEHIKELELIALKNEDIESASHAVRVAIIKYIREQRRGQQ